MGVGGSGGGSRRRRGVASHCARLGHLLLQLGDRALQLLARLPLHAQLLLQLLPVSLRPLQPLTQVGQLKGDTETRATLLSHISTSNSNLSTVFISDFS